MTLRILVFLLLPSLYGFGQTLPPDRAVDWHQAGVDETGFITNKTIDFRVFAASQSNDDVVLADILNSLKGEPVTIYFPNGAYHFTQPIRLPAGVTLKGESSDSALLKFELTSENHLIQASGNSTFDTTMLKDDISKGEKKIAVENSSLFKKGDYVKIFEEDSLLITSFWAHYSTGQINQIDSIDGQYLYVKSELRRTFSTSDQARIVRIEPVRDICIETLSIERIDKTTAQTSNIHFQYAANCQVKCIQSVNCNFAHIEISNSTNIDVSGSYIHKAFSYGGGGKAYGVMVHFSSGECLIQDNVFQRLRHAMILQAGANGNVFAYNYSFDPFWTGTSLPANSAGDIVLHGNYPYANLFEGNTAQQIVIDDSHGINGPHNTFFRNRLELFGIFMNASPPSGQQNFIGNEIMHPDLFFGNYLLSGSGHFEFGNNHKGTIKPRGSEILPEASLFLEEIPTYYSDANSWPPTGTPNPPNMHQIEALQRFRNGVTTPCNTPPVLTTDIDEAPSISAFTIFPNPTTERIYIEEDLNYPSHISEIEISALDGKRLIKTEHISPIELGHLPSGIYIISVRHTDNSFVSKKFVKR